MEAITEQVSTTPAQSINWIEEDHNTEWKHAVINGCTVRLSQYDDGRWYCVAYIGTDSLYMALPSVSTISPTLDEAEDYLLRITEGGVDSVREAYIADRETKINKLLGEIANVDVTRALAGAAGFSAGWKAGQTALRDVIRAAIGEAEG